MSRFSLRLPYFSKNKSNKPQNNISRQETKQEKIKQHIKSDKLTKAKRNRAKQLEIDNRMMLEMERLENDEIHDSVAIESLFGPIFEREKQQVMSFRASLSQVQNI